MDTLLVIVALVGWVIGILLLSQATYGVGVLAAACLFAILARMAQASRQHQEMRRLIEAQGRALAAQGQVAWVCMQCGTLAPSGILNCPACGTSRPTT